MERGNERWSMREGRAEEERRAEKKIGAEGEKGTEGERRAEEEERTDAGLVSKQLLTPMLLWYQDLVETGEDRVSVVLQDIHQVLIKTAANDHVLWKHIVERKKASD
jgi:hypothetical protein